MNPVRALAIALLFLQLGGCAYITAVREDVVEQVDRMVERERYGRALATIDYIKPEHPDYVELMRRRKEIARQAEAYEKKALARGERLMEENQWEAALDVYDKALRRLPDSLPLQQAMQRFRDHQDRQIDDLKLELLLARGRWLEETLELQEAITRIDPESWRAEWAYDAKRQEAADLGEQLGKLGRVALEEDHLEVALRTLPLAARLAPTEENLEARARLQRVEAEQSRRAREARARTQKRQAARQLQVALVRYREAFEAGELVEARRQMAEMERLAPKDPRVMEQRQALQAAVEQAVRQGMEQGNSLYGRSLFQEAIAAWNRVLQLDPGNEQARANLERARKVLERLEELRRKQQAANDAAAP